MSRPPLKERLKALFAEYGRVAIFTYFAIFFLVLGAFALALSFGVEVEGAGKGATVIGGAYVATKLTQPLRILATLLLTPVVAGVIKRFRPTRGPSEG
jgi:hypothetical protein